MGFTEIFDSYRWEEVKESIYAKTKTAVEEALHRRRRTIEDFKALLSPAAASYLEPMARLSRQLTRKRFGNVIRLYIPLYLSNECQNICTYCGFSHDNDLRRKTLSATEILTETAFLKDTGYDQLLLVSGEAHQTVGIDYFLKAIRLVRPHFSTIAMEVQPLAEEEYALLVQEGLNTVLVYQETYHKDDYRKHHPKGRKSNFYYRLETPDRLGRTGIHTIGLGVLIGLEDWRTDSCFTALHLQYLEKKYWRTRYSLSFPRLRPHSGGLTPKVEMSDRELVQLICAWRLLDEELDLSLSTRESEVFRDHAVKIGITSMSAGSRTNPGGYVVAPGSLEQFEIDDRRSPQEIAAMIRAQGYEPVWKDWDRSFYEANNRPRT